MGASAPDIITYIGVPLAVLGVTPIFWLAYRAVAKKLRLFRDIKSNHLTDTSTRVELLSGIVEVTLSQYQLEPLDRTEDDYWTHDLGRSPPEGGSWTILRWREPHQKIRTVTRRLQYSDKLRLPRAKVDFHSLVLFLLDRGATLRPREPNSKCILGFISLSSNGIRTPVKTKLLYGNNDEPVLEVEAPFDDDFEGLPTLTINGKGFRGSQNNRLLPPPGWLLLRPLAVIEKESNKKAEIEKIGSLTVDANVAHELSVENLQTSEENQALSQSVFSTREKGVGLPEERCKDKFQALTNCLEKQQYV